MTFDEIRKGCYDPAARLADMDTAGIAASVRYPNMFVRFCGQQFSFAPDKELSQACIRAWNDYVIEEWCGGSAGRLVPLGSSRCGTSSWPWKKRSGWPTATSNRSPSRRPRT